jgi:hypothetical protein
MFRILAVLIVLVFFACTGGEPAVQQGSTTNQQAAAGPADGAPPNEQMIDCLNRFRENKYSEAITACRQALGSNPGDPQIQKAIELSEQALKENGGM